MEILELGEVINNTYEVCFFIGEGAFGEVYRVRHKFFNELQVLKVFKKKFVDSEDIEEVVNEGKILAKINHPNVVRVFEINSFIKKGVEHYYITMSFVSGESLSQLVKRKIHLDIPLAISLIIDVLKGLNAAHSHKPSIIHRDINPDNILLSYANVKPRAVLGDFGISALLDKNEKMVGAGGRYLYFAPECFMNIYLPMSDVFSMGLVLYKSLTGFYPWEYDFDVFKSNDQEKIARMINISRKQPAKSPKLYNLNIDNKLDELIMRSIDKDMKKRFKNAQSFLHAISNLNCK